MINEVEVKFHAPKDEAELEACFDKFAFLHNFVPYKLNETQLRSILEYSLPNATLIYANGILIGCFLLWVYKNSAELHGVSRPDLEEVTPFGKQVKLHVFDAILECVFLSLNKDKLIIKGHPDNTGVIGFARMFGFTKLKNMDKGRNVWKLEKQEYLRRKAELVEV